MTDSTIDNPGDGGFDAGASVDDLFGKFEEPSSGDERGATSADEAETPGGETDAIEDRTAADVFDQLRAEGAGEGDADDLLADESPDDIIASADEPDPETETPVDDDLLADDDELTELLLTGRTKDREFLWIDPNASDDPQADAEPDDPATADAATEAADEEPPAVEGDAEAAATTATDAETAREPSESDPVVESESDGVAESDPVSEPDVAAVSDADTTSDTGSVADADAGPETASADASGRRDDADSSPGSDFEAGVGEDPAATDRDGDDAEGDTEAADAETEPAVDETAADDGSSGLLGRLRSMFGG